MLEKINGRTRAKLLLLFAGAAFGGASGFGTGRLVKHGIIDPTRFTWSEQAGLELAVLLVCVGILLTLVSLNRRVAGRLVDPDGERSASQPQVQFYRLQAFVTVLAGVMLGLPALLMQLSPSPQVRAAAYAAVLAMFALQTVLNWALWRRADEFVRRLMADTAAGCFWVLQGSLFLWAAGEKMSLLPSASTWDGLTVMMAVYLAGSFIVHWRYGVR